MNQDITTSIPIQVIGKWIKTLQQVSIPKQAIDEEWIKTSQQVFLYK